MGKNDLISRAAAIDAIVSVTAFPDADYIKNLCQNPANSEDWLGGVCDAINAVEDVNAVDAVPVVHGKWTEKEWSIKCDWCVTIHNSVICSACNHEIYKGYKTPYCPYCGAKMDGDANG